MRPKGVTRPFRAVQASDIPPHIALGRDRIERAVQALLGAENWDMTHAVLEREQAYLLSDEGIAILEQFARQARNSGQMGSVQVAIFLEGHRRLLERAREVGVDRAWTEFQEQRSGERPSSPEDDAEVQRIADTLRRFLSTDSWGETHAVLISEQAILLTEEAEQFLSALIHVAEQSEDPSANEGLYYLELHRNLLREARSLGIAAAWTNFEQARKETKREGGAQQRGFAPSAREAHLGAVTNAIKSLLTTSTWDETRQVLEREQDLLLTDTCDSLLTELIAAAERDHEGHTARNLVYLKMHQRLIQLARSEGIRAAWSSFEEAMGLPMAAGERSGGRADASESLPEPIDDGLRKIRDAVQSFLGASSWSAAYAILREHRDDLLTDLAIALIGAQADQMQARGTERDLYATRLLNLQAQLLRRARAVGVERAWSEFEDERQ